MNNATKAMIHAAVIFGLIYLCSAGIFLAQFILAIYLMVLFFESEAAVFFFLFFIFLLPFFVYNLRADIAEHYAISAYIFLGGCVLNALADRKKVIREFFALNYSQVFCILAKEKIFEKEGFSKKFNEVVSFLIISSVFIFLLLSPLFNFLLTVKKTI